MNESLLIANYISETGFDSLPSEAIRAAKLSFLDGIGVTLAAGTLGEGCQPFVEISRSAGGRPESSVIGFNFKTAAFMAAFAGGSLSHALDYEDTHDRARVHPNAATIPAALAVAEALGNINGKEFITSLALSSDVVCRLGLAFNDDPLKYGWYIAPILGAFGATAGVCKLMRLSSWQILNAFSLTLCQATCSGELTESPNSMVRAIRDAFAAKTAVISAQLASANVTGFEHPLEGKAGLFRLYAREDFDLAKLTSGLGKIFEGSQVSYKPWPSCRGTHYFIVAALQLMKENQIKTNEIEEIIIGFSPGVLNTALCEPLATKRKPLKAIDAKFSIPFTVALAIARENVALEYFSLQALQDPAVLAIAARVNYQTDKNIGPDEGWVRVRTANGWFESKIPKFAPGHPQNPLSTGGLILKFKNCARYAPEPVPPAKLDRFIDQVLHLEKIPRVGDLIQNLIA